MFILTIGLVKSSMHGKNEISFHFSMQKDQQAIKPDVLKCSVQGKKKNHRLRRDSKYN